jgi:hypothetical protein
VLCKACVFVHERILARQYVDGSTDFDAMACGVKERHVGSHCATFKCRQDMRHTRKFQTYQHNGLDICWRAGGECLWNTGLLCADMQSIPASAAEHFFRASETIGRTGPKSSTTPAIGVTRRNQSLAVQSVRVMSWL